MSEVGGTQPGRWEVVVSIGPLVAVVDAADEGK